MIRDARRATSAGEAAAVAPAATISSTGGRLRLWTTSVKPRLRRLRAMGRPMTPRPMNPTVPALMGATITRARRCSCYRFFAFALVEVLFVAVRRRAVPFLWGRLLATA